MRLRITIAMLEIRNRETLQSKVNICKSDVKIGDYADSLTKVLQYVDALHVLSIFVLYIIMSYIQISTSSTNCIQDQKLFLLC